ncbi:UNVERIFIED_CONTAM: hypothetical protein PYX00_000347 [Menopon gallinae]|uniref:UNC93-like protein MFSD11 n=1 Tax=Menopon gallinae TaxID=328185 RepID=A0AAW2I8R5_9NEOP
MNFDTRFVNIILLGFGFMFIFTAFQTTGNIEETVLSSLGDEFKGAGYISLAVLYAVFATCNWIAPSVISLTGPKIAMLIGGAFYTLFIFSFLFLEKWLLYVVSVLVGVGAALIWTGQGNYLILNSDEKTMSRNAGVFWAMVQCSLFFGNLFVFFKFKETDEMKGIEEDTKNVVFTVLGIVSALGIVFLAVLRPAESSDGKVVQSEYTGPVDALKSSLKLFATKQMLLLLVTFFYTGIELSFFSGVYSTSIGHTKSLGADVKSLVGLSGVFIGVGEVLGGVLFSILGAKTVRWGRDPIVIIGFVIHVLSFFLIFINLPNQSPIDETHDEAFIESNRYLALFCSFLLGFGDSCYNTQIYTTLGNIWSSNSAPAVAIFKFTQSVAAAACFFYSGHATLQVHLGILIALGTLGTVTYCYVEWLYKAQLRKQSPAGSSANNSESDLTGQCN